jgi:hypothetical protein
MPSAQREDLRYGEPHLNRGDHPIYGPDHFDMLELEKNKPTLESHGFYLAHEEPKRESRWKRIKRSLIVRTR